MGPPDSAPESPVAPCADCGLPQADGVPLCQRFFDEILAQHFSNPAYFGVHRLFVDTFCLQHPDRGCVSSKSFAAHAMHVCWSLERGGTRAVPSEPIRRWVERHPHLVRPLPPNAQPRGTLTIANVARAVTPADHHDAVERWARDVWSAYADLHPTVRRWIDQACVTSPSRLAARKRTG